MEKDPQAVARLAAEREAENWRFRSFLKQLPRRRQVAINALAARLGGEIEAQMDCRTCATCCRVCHVPIDDAEVRRLAGLKKRSVPEFRSRHMEPDDDGAPAMRSPCSFLEGTVCAVYQERPDACRHYPYIGGDIASRSIGILERAGTCPIIFELLERLKDAIGFRRYR